MGRDRRPCDAGRGPSDQYHWAQTISPEICLGWLEAHTNQSVVQTLAAFVQYKTFFYRPVEHVLIHFFFQIVDAITSG